MAELALEISCCGPFRAMRSDGLDVTPKGAKSQAILAMLACGENRRRNRRWLEERLWSNKPLAQASGSLRQALTVIRKAIKPCGDILGADRRAVWLTGDNIRLDIDEEGCDLTRFLEDLDIRDPAYQNWVARRRGVAPAPAARQIRGVRLNCVSDARNGGVLGSIVADQIGQSLEERVSSWMVEGTGDVLIKCDLTDLSKRSILTVRILHEDSGSILYSGYREIMGDPGQMLEPGFLAPMIHEATGKALWKLPQVLGLDRPEIVANGFANIALRRLSAFSPEKLSEADDLFARAFESDPNGLYLAWRAFVRMAQVVDRDQSVEPGYLEEVNALLCRALEHSPDNSLALSLVSLTRNMLFDQHEVAAELANIATRTNPNSLLARQSLAVAAAGTDGLSAYKASQRCQSALGDDGLRHLWDLYHSLVCINVAKFEEATEAAERAAKGSLAFLAPRRQLLGLYLTQGRMEEAEALIKEIKTLEPGFSLDRYLNDHDYPVLTLRNSGLLKQISDLLDQ